MVAQRIVNGDSRGVGSRSRRRSQTGSCGARRENRYRVFVDSSRKDDWIGYRKKIIVGVLTNRRFLRRPESQPERETPQRWMRTSTFGGRPDNRWWSWHSCCSQPISQGGQKLAGLSRNETSFWTATKGSQESRLRTSIRTDRLLPCLLSVLS